MTENIIPSNFDPRSEAIIAYTVMLIALARDFSMTPADLSRWVLDQAMARGYDVFLFNGEKPTVTEYARHFSEGRKLIYHHVDMVEHLQSVSVCSQLYMTDKNHIPDAFICMTSILMFTIAMYLNLPVIMLRHLIFR
ncbi:hypothetical protein [Cronobacter sakazakii]|uniref:hypothetical protein n=1 Tax=Cronobacter sakazakii TaxID=28141 RepID=UPI003518E1D0